MEQNNLNNEVYKVTSVKGAELKEIVEKTKEKIEGKYVLLSVVIAVSIFGIYSYWWVHYQYCRTAISFNPAGEQRGQLMINGMRTGSDIFYEAEHYSYGFSKFKNRGEAMGYCISQQRE